MREREWERGGEIAHNDKKVNINEERQLIVWCDGCTDIYIYI